MFKRLMNRWMLLEGESGDVPAGGAPSAAPAADAAPAAPADLTPPESMLNDKPADAEAPAEPGAVGSDQNNTVDRSLTPSEQPAATATQGVVMASTSRPKGRSAIMCGCTVRVPRSQPPA